jgi:hypothetical protein
VAGRWIIPYLGECRPLAVEDVQLATKGLEIELLILSSPNVVDQLESTVGQVLVHLGLVKTKEIR